MSSVPSAHRGVRLIRAFVSAAPALVVISCLNDRPTGPGGSARASVHLQRVAFAPAGCGVAPAITLAKARLLLRQPGAADSVVQIANFAGDTVTLSLVVPLSGATALFDMSAQAIDAFGDTVFRARDTVTARKGELSTVRYLNLWYSAPDSALTGLALAPRDTMVPFDASFSMRASGTLLDGVPFNGRVRVGFVSRDPKIVASTASGTVTAQRTPGFAWIVAQSWLGICDSTTVVVLSPPVSLNLAASNVLGLDQAIDSYVSIPSPIAGDLTVTLSHASAATLTPPTVTILAGATQATYRVTGDSVAIDVLTASAPGYASTAATISVDSGRVTLIGWPTTMMVGNQVAVTLESTDVQGNVRPLNVPVTFTLLPNQFITFVDAGGSPVTAITIPANAATSPGVFVVGVASGTGAVTVTGGRFAAYTNTVTVQ